MVAPAPGIFTWRDIEQAQGSRPVTAGGDGVKDGQAQTVFFGAMLCVGAIEQFQFGYQFVAVARAQAAADEVGEPHCEAEDEAREGKH